MMAATTIDSVPRKKPAVLQNRELAIASLKYLSEAWELFRSTGSQTCPFQYLYELRLATRGKKESSKITYIFLIGVKLNPMRRKAGYRSLSQMGMKMSNAIGSRLFTISLGTPPSSSVAA